MYQQDYRPAKVGGSTLQSSDAVVGKSTLVESEGGASAGGADVAEGSGEFTASFVRADDDVDDLAPDPPARNLEANKAEIAEFAKTQPQQPGAEEAANVKPDAGSGGGDPGPVSPDIARSIEGAQGDTRGAVAASQTESTAFKTTMAAQQERFEAEQHATTLEKLKTMSPTDKRSTLKEMGYDAKQLQKVKDSELDGIIEGKIDQQNRKNKILGMEPEERGKLSPGQKTQFLQDLGIDKEDLEQAGPAKCAQCFDDVMKVANVPGQHKVKIQIKSGFFRGKSWEITVKTDADGGAAFDVKKEGGFFSKLWSWIKLALPIILMVLAPITAGASLIVLAVYQTVTAIMAGDWLGAVLGVVGAISGVSAFMAVKGLATASSMITKIADVATKVGKVAKAAQAAMIAAKAKNAGSLLGALADGAATFATFAGKTADAFATKMNEWAAKLKTWSTVVAGGEKVVTSIKTGDPLGAMSGAFDTVAAVIGARGGTTPLAMQRAANITRFVATSKTALAKNPTDYGAVAASALSIAGELSHAQKVEDAAKITTAANRLKLAWDNRESNPGGLAEAAFAVAEAIQTAKYDATHEQNTDANGKPVADADKDAITDRYQRARKIVSAAAAIVTAATAKPRPNYVAALSAATTLAEELTTNQRIDDAAKITTKLDAWTAAIASKDEMAIIAAGRALGETINNMRAEITKERDDAKQAAEAKLAPGETLAPDPTEIPSVGPVTDGLPGQIGEQMPLPSLPDDAVLAGPPDPAPDATQLPRIQLGGTGKEDTPNANYTVFKGDSLSWIAQRFNTTVAHLLELNPQIKGNQIFAGQKLFVPGAEVKLPTNVAVDVTYSIDASVERGAFLRSVHATIETWYRDIMWFNKQSSMGAPFYYKVEEFRKKVAEFDDYVDRSRESNESLKMWVMQLGAEDQGLYREFQAQNAMNNLAIDGGLIAAQVIRDGAGVIISVLDPTPFRVISVSYQATIAAIDEIANGGTLETIAFRAALAGLIEELYPEAEGRGLVENRVNEGFREAAATLNEMMAELRRDPNMSEEKRREIINKYIARIPAMTTLGVLKGNLMFTSRHAEEARKLFNEL